MQITINDKQYDLSWGMGAIEIYCDRMECDIEGLNLIGDTTNALKMQKALTTLVLAAIQNGCEVSNKPFDITYRQLQYWLSEADQTVFKSIIDDFMASKYFGSTVSQYLFGIEPLIKETPKKKSRSVKS